jgi:hypothetical protein
VELASTEFNLNVHFFARYHSRKKIRKFQIIEVPEYLNMDTPAVSIPMHCIILLLVAFFAVFLITAISKTYREVSGCDMRWMRREFAL